MKKKVMKMIQTMLCVMLFAALFTAGTAFAEETAEGFTNDLLKTVDASTKDDAYYQELLEACIYNNKVIRNYPFTFEDESWHDYRKALNKAVKVEEIDEDAKAVLDTAVEALEAMVQIEAVEDHCIEIWGESMPCVEDPSTLVYDFDSWDVPEFRPFLVPYIMEEQTEAKGNIILVSGGGFTHRANDSEGYVIAPLFNELGYNVFVLQRRVAPYDTMDIFMDLQRSIRVVRHNIEAWGLGSDYMIINGYSGGGGTVMGVIQNLYGDIQPSEFDPNYIPDEIDAEDSDVNAAFVIYGAGVGEEADENGKMFKLDNPELPALFIAVGGNDMEPIYKGSIILAQEANELTLVDLHVFGNTGHGFGKGLPKSNSVYWMEMADNFVSIDKATAK